MTLSLTKWSRLVRTIDEIPEVIAEGFHWARSGRPGPVVIDIPTDMLKAKKEFSGPVKFTPHAPTGGCESRVAHSATRLLRCCSSRSKPVALVGAGAKLSGAIPDCGACSITEYSDLRHSSRIGSGSAGSSVLPRHGRHARNARRKHCSA